MCEKETKEKTDKQGDFSSATLWMSNTFFWFTELSWRTHFRFGFGGESQFSHPIFAILLSLEWRQPRFSVWSGQDSDGLHFRRPTQACDLYLLDSRDYL
jgi:hypothetical protein